MLQAHAKMTERGFKTTLWEPEFGWDSSENDASENPFPPQLLASFQIFLWMYTDGLYTPDKRMWVHLAAEMQAGKTGVITALIRLVLKNRSLNITPERCFVLTGMSDGSWVTQTKKRMPKLIRENVHHAGTLAYVKGKLESLSQRNPDKKLSNVLITIDESHIASAGHNQPTKYIYDIVANLCPREEWVDRNIRFVTISATDPAKVLAMQISDSPTAVVRLLTGENYQSVEKLKNAKRLRFVERSGSLHSEKGFSSFKTEVNRIESLLGPMIHIIRPEVNKTTAVIDLIARDFPNSDVISWDNESNRARKRDDSSSTDSSSDINVSQLSKKPSRTRFIILKGMFRAAKTMDDTHIGVLFDRIGLQDATTLQSLLGRACGYNKSQHTVIFTSENTVENYLKLWKELCASKQFPSIVSGIPVSKLRGKMPSVGATKKDNKSALTTKDTHSSPLESGVSKKTKATVVRRKVNEDDFSVEWSEPVRTLEEAKELGAGQMDPDENGFYKNAAGTKKGPMTVAQLLKVKSGKKTAYGREHDIALNEKQRRTFPYYEDPNDPSTLRFVVRTLTRIRESEETANQEATIPVASE